MDFFNIDIWLQNNKIYNGVFYFDLLFFKIVFTFINLYSYFLEQKPNRLKYLI